jgi:hypothetical protein
VRKYILFKCLYLLAILSFYGRRGQQKPTALCPPVVREICNNVIHYFAENLFTMSLTVRLAPHLQQQLDNYCKKRRVSKSRVVTELLSEHLSAVSGGSGTAYQLAQAFGLIGGFASGKGDLSENRKQYLVEKLRAKRSR